jgi:TnpA family transposase
LRTGETVADQRMLMARLLTDRLNLGLTRMAGACTVASLGQLAWTVDWHSRRDLCPGAAALGQSAAARAPWPLFGGETASSSDGQFFRAGGFGRDAARLNAHYGDEPGSKFYTHLSGRYSPFHTR